jgi:hypothetical protein
MPLRFRSVSTLLLLSFLFPLTAAGQVTPPPSADDLLLVDCRLPSKTRQIGGKTYPIGRKPMRTTAVDCRIRGGEYTVYDRANYQTSLRIWLAEAEKGNAEAQYYVGKIYEGGLGTEPDYKSAASWYEKAAAAGHSASQYSLGALYEKGLGVPADSTKAFDLYRRASGLSGNFVIVESAKYEALEKAAFDLALREQEIEELQRQLDDAKKKLKRDETFEHDLQKKLDNETRKTESQKKEMLRLQSGMQDAAKIATPSTTKLFPAPSPGSLGRFFALVIGNSQYENLPPVPSAEADARAMEALLRDQYGFQVTLLLNAKNATIQSTLYKLSQNLAENDNLVVFYAGHGRRELRNRRGWWLPVDAVSDSDSKTNWLPNQDVSDRLALIPAKHILVLADASYVGDITRGVPEPEPQHTSAAEWSKYVDSTKRRKARLALSSGADGPLPGAAGQTSRFTATLINVLQRQKGVFPASRIHRQVVDALTADGRVSSAVPTYAPLQSASHEGVDFLFERKPGS